MRVLLCRVGCNLAARPWINNHVARLTPLVYHQSCYLITTLVTTIVCPASQPGASIAAVQCSVVLCRREPRWRRWNLTWTPFWINCLKVSVERVTIENPLLCDIFLMTFNMKKVWCDSKYNLSNGSSSPVMPGITVKLSPWPQFYKVLPFSLCSWRGRHYVNRISNSRFKSSHFSFVIKKKKGRNSACGLSRTLTLRPTFWGNKMKIISTFVVP